MKIKTCYPSRYLRVEDLNDKPVTLIITSVAVEDVGGQGKDEDTKPVIYFKDTPKGFVLNKTNMKIIVKKYGDETDDWVGKYLTLRPSETEFRGDVVECIRVRVPENVEGFDDAIGF